MGIVMQINCNKSNIAFQAQKPDYSRENISMLTGAVGSTIQRIEDFDDFILTAKNAIDSPEDAAIRTLNKKLDKVANNEKTPKPIKNAAKYSSAFLITALTFIATKKVIKAPGKFIDIAKKQLDKSNTGKNILRHCSNINKVFKNAADNLNDSKLGELKTFLGKKYHAAVDYLSNEFPRTATKLTDIKRTFKIDKWTKNDYLKNVFSGVVALTSGKEYIKRYNAKAMEAKRLAEIPDDDAEIVTEAA